MPQFCSVHKNLIQTNLFHVTSNQTIKRRRYYRSFNSRTEKSPKPFLFAFPEYKRAIELINNHNHTEAIPLLSRVYDIVCEVMCGPGSGASLNLRPYVASVLSRSLYMTGKIKAAENLLKNQLIYTNNLQNKVHLLCFHEIDKAINHLL